MSTRLRWIVLAASLALVPGSFSADTRQLAPNYKFYTLHAEKVWQMNLPDGHRFDASGLYLDKSHELLTESDQAIGVYKIKFGSSTNSVDLERIPDCFTAGQLAPFAKEKYGRYDCEGICEDDLGRIYLCEEANRWILRWDPVTKKVARLDFDWTPVKKYFSSDRDAAWEGIAIDGRTIYLANERKQGRLIIGNLDTLKISDDFVLAANRSIWFWDAHYSDLCWFDGALFVLMREDHVILKVDPKAHTILAEYDFRKMEEAKDVDYFKVVPLVTGVMEGLAVDRNYFWLCTDNNGLGRKKHPHDIRPTLFKCRRPDAF